MNRPTHLLGLLAATTLLGCATTPPAPEPESYDPKMAFTLRGSVYSWTLEVLDARLADPRSLPEDQLLSLASACARILAANPDHADAPAVRAHLDSLRALIEANPPARAHLANDASGSTLIKLDLNTLRRDVELATPRTYARTLGAVEGWITHNPNHAVLPELRAMAATLRVVPVTESARLASYYVVNGAQVGGYHASARALLTRPRVMVDFALAEHYAPRDSNAAPTLVMRPRGRAPKATRGTARVVPITRVAGHMCSRLGLGISSLTEYWGTECRREASSAWVAALTDRALYLRDGALDPEALDAALSAIWIDPDATLSGSPARDLYALYQPSVAAHLRVWKNIQRVGERKIMKGWRAERKRSAMNGGDLVHSFYRDRARFPGVFEGFSARDRAATEIYGFWLRRIDDGTAPVILDHAKRLTTQYDPALHDEVF